MKRQSDSVKLIAALSLLSAVGIILGKYLAFNLTEYLRFSLESLSIIFASIVFGPIYGMAVGIVQDIVGCILVGYAINPIITLGCAMCGLITGLTFRALKNAPIYVNIPLSVILSHTASSVVIKSLGLAWYYGLPVGITMLTRLINYLLIAVIESTIMILLLKSKQLLSVINKIYPQSQISKYRKKIKK